MIECLTGIYKNILDEKSEMIVDLQIVKMKLKMGGL